MVTLFTIFASSFIIALSGALMPGPLLTATISESSQRGFIAGPMMIADTPSWNWGWSLRFWQAWLLFFSSRLFLRQARWRAVILLWMAFGLFRGLPSLTLNREVRQKRLNHPVASGIFMSVSNPYWIIWWATIGLGYILYSWQFGIWVSFFFFTGHILADLAWYSFIAGAVAGQAFPDRPPLPRSDCLLRGFSDGVCRLFAYAGFPNCKRLSHNCVFIRLKISPFDGMSAIE